VNIHWRLYPLEDAFRAWQGLGFERIELWAGAPHFLLGWEGYQDCGPVKEAMKARGLSPAALLIESVSYPFGLCCSVPGVWEKSVEYFKNGVRAAKELGAPLAVLSCAGGLFDRGKELAKERALSALRQIAETAEEEGVTVAVQTLAPDQSFVYNTLGELKELLDGVSSPRVRACLDICAMRTAGETLDQWFDALGDDIVHIHFTDGRPAGRLVWGEGLHPLDEYLKTIEERGYRGCLGLDLNVRGNWFDPAYLDEEKGWTGRFHAPGNYWFFPEGADSKALEALTPYIGKGE
jgi:protein FrlC